MTCKICGKEIIRRRTSQKYCPECRKAAEHKRRWRRKIYTAEFVAAYDAWKTDFAAGLTGSTS